MPSRRRREVELERVLDTPALFATAYDNVGSSIYYALGIVRGARAPGSRTHFRESDASRPRR